ncbi:MAG: tetratricopeptide repeat protein [Bacteroidales bacterium]
MLYISACSDGSDPGSSEESTAPRPGDPVRQITEEIRGDSANAALYNERAGIYIREGKLNSALNDLNRAIKLSPGDPELYMTLSDVYIARGDVRRCREALKKAISLDPGNQSAYLKMAELNLLLREYNNTFKYVGEALDLEAYNPVAYYIKGFAYMETGDTNRAVENFMIAADQDQEYYDAFMQLGTLFSLKKDPKAIDYYKNAIEAAPDNTEAHYALAMFYQETGALEPATRAYERLLDIDPRNKYALYNLGFINLVYFDDFESAAAYFSQALEIDPEYADAYYNRGYSYELRGLVNEARRDYQKALEVNPNHELSVRGLNRLDLMAK